MGNDARRIARADRDLLGRAVRLLARSGVRQFVDIGAARRPDGGTSSTLRGGIRGHTPRPGRRAPGTSRQQYPSTAPLIRDERTSPMRRPDNARALTAFDGPLGRR
ncbi:hypothetical protein [Nonomuraea indica]|uniref:Uncharacterized protein n=1 Tax=Nonomuraea indica TaxID=1581193 RepID=A0ABW8ACW3_9ACTN